MTAGLPGTGIGGLYYLLLALWMPVHELLRILRGRAGPRRWGDVARQFPMAVGILAALWGEAWLIKELLIWAAWKTPAGSYWHTLSRAAWGSLAPLAATWISFGILGAVVLTTHVLRIWVRPGRTRHGPTAGMR